MIWTDIALVGAVVALLVIEGIALVSKRSEDLITDRVRKWSRATHLLPFLGGLLAGHFWWCG